MQIRLGGEADEQELYTELWQRWCRVLTKPAQRVYEFLVEEYSNGLEEIDTKVLAKHCQTTQNAMIKDGGIFEELESHGLVARAETD